MKMTNSNRAQSFEKKPRTRYIRLTKYELETGCDRESKDGAGSMKNFPRAFIPMEELEESLSDE
jgi:hypothetical protein